MSNRNKPPRRRLDAGSTIRQVTGDEFFREEYERNGKDMHKAFGAHALTLVDLLTEESGNRPPLADQIHVAATIDDYVSAKTDLDNGMLHPSEIKGTKAQLIAFNHAVKQLVDNDPGANYNEVAEYLNTMYRAMRPHESDTRYEYVDQKFRETLKGMVNEIVAEQLAGYLGYDVNADVTVADEIQGIDMRFIIDGYEYPADIKSSTRKADEMRAKDGKGRMILATNIPDEVIGCSFRLPYEDVPKYSQYFQREIDAEKARVDSIRAKRRRGRREYGIPA